MIAVKKKRKTMSIRKQEAITAYIFVAPFVLGYLVFTFIPVLFSVFISFIDFNRLGHLEYVLGGMVEFVGFKNFTRIFTDKIALEAFFKSFLYIIYFVPGRMVFGLLLAVFFNKEFYLRKLSRTLVLVPYVTNIVAVTIIFAIILDKNGIVNSLLKLIGINDPPMWLFNASTVLPVTAFIGVWQSLALVVIVYLAALQGVPTDLYEACSLDGANSVQKFFHVTLPLISPTTFFLIINNVILAFSNFALIKNLTGGGPGTASRVAVINIYEEAFTFNHYSYAAAQSIVMFIIILIFSAIQWKGQKKWVHY